MTDIGTQATPEGYYIDKNQLFYEFSRYAVEDSDGAVALSQLHDDEIVIWPGFIYKKIPPLIRSAS